MIKKGILVLMVILLALTVFSGCGKEAEPAAHAAADSAAPMEEPRVYYYVAPLMGHPYIYDQHLGFKYAAEQFGVEIIKMGPDGWDTAAAAQAFEQVIAKKPDGIVCCLWDPSMVPAIKAARAAGIQVISIEAIVPDSGVSAFIGLDNYECGVDTAKELINRAGTKGNLVVQGNWGASNTEAKLAGFMDYLTENSSWKVVTRVDDKANTEVSIDGAKSAFNNFKDLQGYVGLDSSSAPGIGAAMEELGIAPGSLTVITHDREDATLEYIEAGYVTATIVNKTAMQAYLAIGMLEMWNTKGFGDVPVSSDNEDSGFDVMPQLMYNGSVTIEKSNVANFMHDKMGTYNTKLYH